MKDITVLFVDDEKNVLNSLEYNLVREPYKKLFAQNGDEALSILGRESVQVVVSDMRMPGMDGLALLTKVKETYPGTVRIILSAFTDIPQIIASINRGEIFRYVTKPIEEPAEFRKIIQQAIDYYMLRRDREDLIVELRQRNQECQLALARVKRLEGLIPICCYCKKIRDDHNYWEDVENYVSEHSEAQFSHGICPDCIKKYVEPMMVERAIKRDEKVPPQDRRS
jgi:DNA-binding NtrC family response regulator